jgi:hypothetical protein
MLNPLSRYAIDDAVYGGAWLIQHGLPLPPMKAETSAMFEVKPV